jgi:hypothetical protein
LTLAELAFVDSPGMGIFWQQRRDPARVVEQREADEQSRERPFVSTLMFRASHAGP